MKKHKSKQDKSKSKNDFIREKLIQAEKSGFTNDTKEQILAESKAKSS